MQTGRLFSTTSTSCSSFWANLTSWCRGNCLTFPACADNIFILLGVRKNRTSPSRLDFHMPSSGTVLTTDSMAKSDRSAAHQKVARSLCTWSASKRHNPPCLPVFADSPSVVTPTSFVSLPPVRSKALFTASSSQGAPFFSGECMTTNTLVVAAMCGSEVIWSMTLSSLSLQSALTPLAIAIVPFLELFFAISSYS